MTQVKISVEITEKVDSNHEMKGVGVSYPQGEVIDWDTDAEELNDWFQAALSVARQNLGMVSSGS